MNEKVKNIIGYTLSTIFVVALAYFILQSSSINFTFDKKIKYFFKNNATFKNLATNDFDIFILPSSTKPRNLSDRVIEGIKYYNSWKNILNTNKKVIFYAYDTNSDGLRLNDKIVDYVDSNKGSYMIYNFTNKKFESLNKAYDYGQFKICNSLATCNKQRTKAANHSEASFFLKSCADNFCIINPRKKEYIIIKDKSVANVLGVLANYKRW